MAEQELMFEHEKVDPYNYEQKRDFIQKSLSEIDPPIKMLILKLNILPGILTRNSCSGHFSTETLTKSFFRNEEHINAYSKEMTTHTLGKAHIGYSSPYLQFDYTPEAERLALIFLREGFCIYNQNDNISVHKPNSKVDWNKILKNVTYDFQE
jgi:hypothetical protein